MADYITTDTMLIESGLIVPNEKARLTPPDWREVTADAGPWTPWHQRAWRVVLRHLANRNPPIAEDELSDPTEFEDLTLHYVLYLAYMAGGDSKTADEHFRAYKHQVADIQPTITGLDTETTPWGFGIDLGRV